MILKRADTKDFERDEIAKMAALHALGRGREKADKTKQVSDVHVPENWRGNGRIEFEPIYATA